MQYVEELAVSDAPLKSTIFACCMSAQTQPTSLQLPTGPQSITRPPGPGSLFPPWAVAQRAVFTGHTHRLPARTHRPSASAPPTRSTPMAGRPPTNARRATYRACAANQTSTSSAASDERHVGSCLLDRCSLAAHTDLTTLDIRWSNVTAAGKQALRTALPNLTIEH